MNRSYTIEFRFCIAFGSECGIAWFMKCGKRLGEPIMHSDLILAKKKKAEKKEEKNVVERAKEKSLGYE